uniref:Putative methyltransferase n=1 Tax=viral metagenome TaxID=1070528 RepID=A0A6M3JY61_9ZZZZ
MGNETTKANKRRKNTWLFNKVFRGRGIDIGPGRDTLSPADFPGITEMEGFDKRQGDAQHILRYKNPDECAYDSYDFVYSSHCLEHLDDTLAGLREWWALVRPGGYMVLAVPDEDLYEQGRFQARSRWSREHKHSFTIWKRESWCRWSINVMDMVKELPDCQVIKVELVDTDYDYSIPYGSRDQTMPGAEAAIEIVLRRLVSGRPYGR